MFNRLAFFSVVVLTCTAKFISDLDALRIRPVPIAYPEQFRTSLARNFITEARAANALPEEDFEVVRCAHRVNGKVFTKDCFAPAEKRGDFGVACYTLWHNDQVTQDCWVHQQVALSQCDVDKCESKRSPFGVNFCCCFGDECNANFSVAPIA